MTSSQEILPMTNGQDPREVRVRHTTEPKLWKVIKGLEFFGPISKVAADITTTERIITVTFVNGKDAANLRKAQTEYT